MGFLSWFPVYVVFSTLFLCGAAFMMNKAATTQSTRAAATCAMAINPKNPPLGSPDLYRRSALQLDQRLLLLAPRQEMEQRQTRHGIPAIACAQGSGEWGVLKARAESDATLQVVKLPYGFKDLEPFIDAKTMEIHHDKHYANYVGTVNRLTLGGSLLQIMEDSYSSSKNKNEALYNAAAQVFNHQFYFQGLSPRGGGAPQSGSAIAGLIDKSFGDYQTFRAEFSNAGASVFGSGLGCSEQVKQPYGDLKDCRCWESVPTFTKRCTTTHHGHMGARVLSQVPESKKRVRRHLLGSPCKLGLRRSKLTKKKNKQTVIPLAAPRLSDVLVTEKLT